MSTPNMTKKNTTKKTERHYYYLRTGEWHPGISRTVVLDMFRVPASDRELIEGWLDSYEQVSARDARNFRDRLRDWDEYRPIAVGEVAMFEDEDEDDGDDEDDEDAA